MASAFKWTIRILLGLAALSLLGVLAYRVLPPPVTPLMLLRAIEGEPIHAPGSPPMTFRGISSRRC